MPPIMLRDIWNVGEPTEYKLHFARNNGHNEPLDVWTRNSEEWQNWQEYWPGKNDFNRPYVFSLMRFYHEPDIWLFGGIWKIKDRLPDRYDVEMTDAGGMFLGRLKLKLRYTDRGTRVRLENHYDAFEVQEILREPYSGSGIPGLR